MQQAPSLESARLVLRGHTLDDFADSAAMWSDPEITRHISGRPQTAEEVWTRLLRYAGHWSLLGFGYWVVREKESGRFVGELGFADLRRDLAPPLDVPEAGWIIASWAHGKGYATEAMQVAIQWIENVFGAKQTVCIIAPENLASIRVAQKCGYQERQRTEYKGQPTIVFVR